MTTRARRLHTDMQKSMTSVDGPTPSDALVPIIVGRMYMLHPGSVGIHRSSIRRSSLISSTSWSPSNVGKAIRAAPRFMLQRQRS